MENSLNENNACIESKTLNDLPNCKLLNDLKVNDCSTDLDVSKNHIDGDIQLSCEKNSLNNDLINDKGDAVDEDAIVEKPVQVNDNATNDSSKPSSDISSVDTRVTNHDDAVNDVGSVGSPNSSSVDTNVQNPGTVNDIDSKSSANVSPVDENVASSSAPDDDDDALLADDPSDVPVVAENEDRLLGDDDSLDGATNKCDTIPNDMSVDEASIPEVRSPSVDQTPEVRSPSVDQTPDVRSPSVDQTPDVRSPSVDQTPDVRSPSVDQTPDVRSPSVDQTPDVRSPSTDQTPDVRSPSVDQTPDIRSPSVDQTPDIRSPSVDQTPDVRSPSVDQTPDIRSPSVDQTPDVRSPSVDQTPDVRSPSVDQTPDVRSPSVDQTPNPTSPDECSGEKAANVEEIQNPSESNSVDETVSENAAQPDEPMVVDENTNSSLASPKPAASPEPMDTLDGDSSREQENVSLNESEVAASPVGIAEVNEEPVDSVSKISSKSIDTESLVIEDGSSETNGRNDDSSKDEDPHPRTEVFQVDENEDDLEIVMDSSEKDPIAQDNENSESPSESSNKNVDEIERSNMEPETPGSIVDENSKDGSTISAEGSASNMGVDVEETSKSSADKESNAEKTSEGADKLGDEGNCIVPDVGDNAAKEVKVVDKIVRKFDITPVRLEKLMDPSKLAAVQLESDSAKNALVNNRPQRQAAKKAENQIKEIVGRTGVETEESEQNAVCGRCSRLRPCKYFSTLGIFSCSECNQNFTEKKVPAPVRILSAVKSQPLIPLAPKSSSKSTTVDQYSRKCAYCLLHNIVEEKSLSWEGMDFCNEECINRYQLQHGSYCAYCNCAVQHVSMGKYAVRFGLDARQFCSGLCLEEFKKGLKSCSYCQLDITNSTDSVSASVGEKQTTLKEFCSKSCVEKYELMSNGGLQPPFIDMCTVCANMKNIEIQVSLNDQNFLLCSDACFRAFKFGNNILDTNQCVICKKFYSKNHTDSFLVYHDDSTHHFCSKICMNVFILFKRKIVPCSWCKVKKYNFDMIRKTIPNGACVMMCSLNCLTLYQVSMNASSSRKIKCDLCSNVAHAQYHLTMSDATIRNFCSYNCVMVFQTQYNKTPLTLNEQNKSVMSVPIVNTASQKSVSTIANGMLSSPSASIKIGSPITVAANSSGNLPTVISTSGAVQIQKQTKYIQQIIVKPPEPKEAANKFTQCRPTMSTKGVSCRPAMNSKGCQTEEACKHPAVLPIPVPIYVPFPMHMYTTPFPVPVPFALPIPVPVFIPTTQKTFKGIMTQMKEILEKTPSNPYEADLLLMAKMVAGEDKNAEDVTKNESGDEGDTHFADAAADSSDSEPFQETENSVSNNFNDEMLQTVMKMANEQLNKTPTVDLEAELTSNTITPQTQIEEKGTNAEVPEPPVEKPRTRKRTLRSSTEAASRKRTRPQQPPAVAEVKSIPPPEVPRANDAASPPLVEGERADASMCLKYTIGVRAWKQWVIGKNEQIEQAAHSANKKAKTFNTNILKLTTDELNYLLCQFVKELRKPNGMDYAPDTVYYLCLSIQQYLFENGRIDNIFTDAFYEPFTNALDEVARKFSDINDATQYIVTRVEEEHLWECKQLGAHSPHVLLATLMFFNTKYFNLATLEEHMQLSFSHIMKHWKRNPNAPAGKPGSPVPNRNVVLRFYPPQAALDAPNSRKKKVYEQHENEVNPLRCPVKLYEFYLSKCPESVKQRNDVFYLQPERSCVPDSPVWYSTMPLQKDLLMKMLHRIRMVKEVNISLLAS